MPNDEAEQMREGMKHKLFSDYILDGKLFIAPIPDNPQKVVDLGTGAGYWALDGTCDNSSFPSSVDSQSTFVVIDSPLKSLRNIPVPG